MTYKAFISYSHAADNKLAPALQSALHRFAKPIFKIRAIRTFRDETTLALTPRLWPAIEKALAESEYLLFLASPGAAASQWVQKELNWWVLNRSTEKMFILVTDSEPWRSNVAALNFDFVLSSFIPDPLRIHFSEEPFFLDLRWARGEEQLSLVNGKFQDQVATISAALRGRDKDTLIGADVRTHKKIKILAWSTIASLAFLLLCAVVSTVLAVNQERVATSRELAAEAVSHLTDGIDLSLLLSIESNRLNAGLQSKASLVTSLNGSPHLSGFLHGSGGDVESIAFRDNSSFVSVGNSGFVTLWDSNTKKRLQELPIPETSESNAVVLSIDRTLLMAAADSGKIMRWDAATLQPLGLVATGHESSVDHIAFQLGDHILATASNGDDEIELMDVKTGVRIGNPLPVGASGVHSITFSSNGRYLAAGDGKGDIFIWDMAAKIPLRHPFPPAHRDIVATLAFGANDTVLASSGYDGTIILWSSETRRRIGAPLTGHSGTVFKLAFSPSSPNMLVSGSVDSTIRVWDVGTQAEIGRPLIGHGGPIYDVGFSPDGKMLASGGLDRSIILWNLATLSSLASSMKGAHANSVSRLSFSPDGSILASGSYDGTVILWDPQTGKPLGRPLVGHSGTIFGMAFDRNGTLLASGGFDGEIVIRKAPDVVQDARSGAKIASLAFSQDGVQLATSTEDGEITFRDAESGKALGPALSTDDDLEPILAYSPDGRTLAYGSSTGHIVFLDAKSHKPIGQPIVQTSEALRSIAFSSDGKLLASAGNDDKINIWDANTHQMIGQPLIAHKLPVFSVAFSPDNRLLASGGGDGMVFLWDVATQQILGKFSVGDNTGVFAVAFSPDGARLASGGPGGAVMVWDLAVDSWMKQACQIANRNLSCAEWRTYLGSWRSHIGLDTYKKTCPTLPDPADCPSFFQGRADEPTDKPPSLGN
jgi:WD40 repeat protein